MSESLARNNLVIFRSMLLYKIYEYSSTTACMIYLGSIAITMVTTLPPSHSLTYITNRRLETILITIVII